jgi:hypothetical protein
MYCGREAENSVGKILKNELANIFQMDEKESFKWVKICSNSWIYPLQLIVHNI